VKLLPAVAALFLVESRTSSKVALGQASGTQSNGSTPVFTPDSPNVKAGDVDVKQLLLLIDTDKNGRISRKEFMDFMAAEFDRLDTDKSGELDIKELEQSQLTTSHHGGTHR
jgi:hypothetical protein